MSTSSDTPHYVAISSPLDQLKSTYDVLVIGTGYAGSIAASRLARVSNAPLSVCVLERGREILPGQFPNTLAGINAETQITIDKPPPHDPGQSDTAKPGSHSSAAIPEASRLFDLRVNEDVCALVGCGLGGGSLINAGVSLEVAGPSGAGEPKINEHVFTRENLEWPAQFRKDPYLLKPYYERARKMLGAMPYPDTDASSGYRPLNKFKALEMSATAMGADIIRPDINVNFEDQGLNVFGVPQPKCNLCGDCCSGCNVGAKNTTLMNYLPDAAAHGAEIYCSVTVNHLERGEDGWTVHLQRSGGGTLEPVTASVVILAAGTLGSNEIMLRSQCDRLQFSKQLGKHFSGNGDVLAFGYNSYWKDNDVETDPLLRNVGEQRYEGLYGVGQGDNTLTESQMPGPCITGTIDMRDKRKPLNQQLVIQEGVVPGAFSPVLAPLYLFAAAEQANFLRYGQGQAQSRLEDVQEMAETLQSNPAGLAQLAYSGPLSRTQNYLVMSHDSSEGRLSLAEHNNRISIHWPDIGKSKTIKRDNDLIAKASDAVQGQFVPSPLWSEALGHKLVSVHPLGGCAMGDNAELGVVNHAGQVFDGGCDGALYDGLYISDGAVLPGSVGVNPLLTISAVAERCVELLCEARGWEIDYRIEQRKNAAPQEAGTRPGSAPPDLTANTNGYISRDALTRVGFLVKAVQGNPEGTYSPEEVKKVTAMGGHVAQTLLDTFPSEYKTRLSFRETMAGYIALTDRGAHQQTPSSMSNPYRLAHRRGRAGRGRLRITNTVQSNDLHALIHDRAAWLTLEDIHIECPSIFPSPPAHQDVSGRMQLLPRDKDSVESWLMIYEIEIDDGSNHLQLRGTKTVRALPGSHWWKDITRMEVDVYDLSASSDSAIAMGLVSLDLQDAIRQARTLSAKAEGLLPDAGIYYAARLALQLTDVTFQAYGGLLSSLRNQSNQQSGDTPATKIDVPPLSPTSSTSYYLDTQDGATLRLTRFNVAGGGLPVILAPGMGVNASSFATDTIDKNLVTFLNDNQFDVWLLDYRASEDSGSSAKAFTIDDIAQYDWPCAIDHILETTGHSQLQVIAHCVGSLSLLMALMASHVDRTQICSLICSQLTLHPVTNWLNNAKADLDIIHELEQNALVRQSHHVVSMNSGTSAFDRAVDVLAYQLPVPSGEACNNPVCRRVFGAYGPSYLHTNINHDTHRHMGAWFKRISLAPFKQMATIIKRGYAVDADGGDRYFGSNSGPATEKGIEVPQLDLPITFIAGALNLMFLPETSQRTYDWLCAHNSARAAQYQRHVFAGYGHMDCFIGKRADRDIYPYLLQQLRNPPSVVHSVT